MQGFRQWLINTYNGLYVIVLKPHMPTIVTIVAVVAAMLLGLIFFGYIVAPVQYYDGAPYQLSAEWRDEWVKLVASAKAAGIYSDEDVIRYLSYIENPAETVQRLAGSTTESLQVALRDLQPLVFDSQGQPIEGTPAPQPGSAIDDLLVIIFAVIVTVILTLVISPVWRILIRPNFVDPVREALRPKTEEDARRKEYVAAIKSRRAQEEEMRKQAATAPQTSPYGAPLTQRLAIYTKGRQFDESFAIENADNVFFGECGATISKKLGDDVAAVEVWLFDKEDFVNQIVKIFVSEKAYSSPEIRAELDEKVTNPATDIVVARPGAVLTLETDRLMVQAKIVDLKPTATAPNSTFEGVTLQMEAWHKGAVAVPAASTQPVPAGAAVPAATQPAYSPQPQPVIPAAPPQPLPSYAPPAQPVAPYTPPMQGSDTPSYTPPMGTPAPRPLTPQPTPRPTPIDDDPFGGTADFDPVTE